MKGLKVGDLIVLLLMQLFWLTTTASTAFADLGKLDCPAACGNISIPYPFGLGANCSIDADFLLECNTSVDPPELLWRHHPVLHISLLQAEMTISVGVSYECYDQNGRMNEQKFSSVDGGNSIPFTFSNRRNKFTMIGCDTMARFNGEKIGAAFKSGCISYCSLEISLPVLSCDGIGCCQTSIPNDIQKYDIELSSFDNFTVNRLRRQVNSCSYAFLVDKDQFNLSVTDFFGKYFLKRSPTVPVVLDWSISESNGNDNDFCLGNLKKNISLQQNQRRYVCNCKHGYGGNPYIVDGCQDIDECEDNIHDCGSTQYCQNKPGSFVCSCPEGKEGDGRKNGSGCTPVDTKRKVPINKIILATGLGFFLLPISISWLYWVYKKRMLARLKEKFFSQNGGLLLQQLSSSKQDGVEIVKIFTAEELERATNKYHESKIIGQGGSGTVYMGILPDNKVAAIKKAKMGDESQIGQFINEIVILYKMNHRNMVKLLGCCLETEAPMLVYEFIANGTLHEHLHNNDRATGMSWENRLRIASETAGALAFLHSAASVPIIHRDVKSTNILLDINFIAKVSDFGASRLIPLDKTQVTTLVQGTLGYLDPEYFHTGQLSQKSDVYSFGVVLVELLTGEKPISQNRAEEERNLPNYFISSMNKNRLLHLLDDEVAKEGDMEQVAAVAQVARSCLMLKSEERPSMREVASELERLRGLQRLPWIKQNQEEAENFSW